MLDEKPDKIVDSHDSAISLLCTIREVEGTSAITIISGIGTDIS